MFHIFFRKMRKKIKRKISNYTTIGNKYKSEIRKQLRMIITFTLGFTIAFTWREYLYQGSINLWKTITKTNGDGALGGAVFITVLSLILIYATAYWLKDNS